jgi:hypothetical protein
MARPTAPFVEAPTTVDGAPNKLLDVNVNDCKVGTVVSPGEIVPLPIHVPPNAATADAGGALTTPIPDDAMPRATAAQNHLRFIIPCLR